jgi:anti-sigma factor ChrR (cupin superfamily)
MQCQASEVWNSMQISRGASLSTPPGAPGFPSPMAGVERRMLDRIGDEVARATSIVRYVPGGHFPTHTHGGGEEFLVLKGVFQDEHRDFPAAPTSAIQRPHPLCHARDSRQLRNPCIELPPWRRFDPKCHPTTVGRANE